MTAVGARSSGPPFLRTAGARPGRRKSRWNWAPGTLYATYGLYYIFCYDSWARQASGLVAGCSVQTAAVEPPENIGRGIEEETRTARQLR